MNAKDSPSYRLTVFIVFLLAFLLRLLLIPNPGFEADISFWKSWGLATYDKGIVEGLKVSNNNYPTPFSYVLGSMVFFYSRFADPHNFSEFWANTNLLFLTISKLYPILADFGIAILIVLLTRLTLHKLHAQGPAFFSQLPTVLGVGYLLNPISLIDGAWWGQVDSLGVFLFLLALVFALKRHAFLAGLLFMTAMMTKLQNMIYGPLFFLFVWQTLGYNGLVKGLAGAAVAFFGLNIEFLLSRNMDRVLSSLTQNYDYFPWMSLNAFNLWWIASGARGMQVLDKVTVLGIANAKTVGLYVFSSLYLLAVLHLLHSTLTEKAVNKKATAFKFTALKRFFESLIIANGAFFLLMTQSHDRYAFPLSVFLLLWGVFYVTKPTSAHKHIATLSHGYIDKRKFKLFTLFYLLFTILYFYNLHTALVFNYPGNGLPILSKLTHPAATITASFLQLSLFSIFLLTVVLSYRLTVFLIPISSFIILVTVKNLPLLTNKPVSLTSFSPIVSQQDFGIRRANMPVATSNDSRSWRWLSVQYAFYKKGIGTHANSFHTFDINRTFKRFSFDYGIDTEAGSKGSAVFEVYGDDRLLFRSEKIARYDLPRHAEIEVTGIKTLGLVTTDAGDGTLDDHTDWLNPQLFP